MSAPDDRFPTTTGRAIALAAVAGTLALAVHEPAVIAGGLSGAVLAAAILGFTGSLRRVATASALVPVAALGAVAGIGLAASLTAVALTILATIVGVAAVTFVTARPSPAALRRAGSASLYAAVAAGGVAVLAFGVETAGGVRPVLATALWLTGDGVTGLLVAVVVAGAAVVGGLIAVPPAALTAPRRRYAALGTRNTLAWAVGFGTAIALAALSVTALLAGPVPLLEGFVGTVVSSTVVRGLVTAVTVSGVVLAAFGLLVRDSWHRTSRRENPVVAVVVGTVCGVVIAFPVAVVASGGSFEAAAALFVGTGIVLAVGWPTMAWYAGALDGDGVAAPTTAVAASLAVGGIVTGTNVDLTGGGTGAAWTGLASLVAIGAGLFAYDVGRYGGVLAREVGADGSSRRPQFVRLAWSGTLAVAGVVVAAGGLWLATLVAPTLSVPATTGVIAGLAAIVAGAWLLLR